MKAMTVSAGVGIVTYDVVLRVPAAEDQGRRRAISISAPSGSNRAMRGR
jgi:hypothetical protein